MRDDRLPTPEQIANRPVLDTPSTCVICWTGKYEAFENGVCADCRANLQRRAIDLAAENARLRKAGDAMADKLRRSPGIDPMRSLVLDDWREARNG